MSIGGQGRGSADDERIGSREIVRLRHEESLDRWIEAVESAIRICNITVLELVLIFVIYVHLICIDTFTSIKTMVKVQSRTASRMG